ncbi:hypothetical protein GCM10023095_18680 [Pseudaeromonas paramecii]|uniref:Glycoside hydrolase family 19 catalytic domain-containing protein n=1 Tax=Pseudaeromonas paramecii TaxID=2138166 RepID=A0ABP8Q876_9GAMM
MGPGMKGKTESFQFSSQTLLSFSQYYRNHPSEAQQDGYIKDARGRIIRRADEQAIGRKHYLRLNNNRQDHPGDGYNFRGRGLIQITGYGKYNGFMSDYSNLWHDTVPDVLRTPDLVNDMPYAIRSALWFWSSHHIYSADHNNGYNDVLGVTRVVNGGSMGLAERQSAYRLCESIFL